MKKIIITFITVLIAFIFPACDGSTKNLIIKDIIYDDYFELPIKTKKAYTAGNSINFNIEKSLQEIKDCIEATEYKKYSIRMSIFSDQFLLIEKTTKDKKVHYYMVASISKNWFDFFVPASAIKHEDGYILIPYHLFNLPPPIAGATYCIEFNQKYKTNASVQSFKEFYDKIDLFETSVESEKLTIKINTDVMIYGKHSAKDFEITFSVENGDVLATYSLI